MTARRAKAILLTIDGLGRKEKARALRTLLRAAFRAGARLAQRPPIR